MIDARLIPLQTALLTPLGRWLVARGVSADHLTLTGFVLGVLALPALALQAYSLALVCFLGNRLLDGLDGIVARLTRPTDRGACLDIAFDFVVYALFPLGFALADPERNALAAAVLISAFVGTGSSFLAYAIIAERRGQVAVRYRGKGIHYLGGLTEGAETIAVFILMALFPSQFVLLAWLFAAACLITTLSRWRLAWIVFSDPPAADPASDPQGGSVRS